MKKLLVVLLAVVLVFGLATSAFAYTDTDDLGTVQQDSIYRLSALGVLNGYPDGTFGATSQITRAEFAKMACELAGLGDVSDVLKNTPSSFSDVAAGAWYTGYINVAASQGFINGYPDGTFLPNNNISMAEVVTILMRVAGYNDNLPGPWPFDYIAEAGKQDVTDDVTFVSNLAATRSDVAVMSNNALDMILVNWDSDSSKFVEDEDDTTLLTDSFGASVFEDVIFANDSDVADALDGWVYSDFDDNEITLDFNDDDYVMNEDCYISGGNRLTDLGGMQADVILNDEDEVIYVNVTSYVVYTDDIEGTIADENLEINGDEVNVVDEANLDNDGYDYAKVFFNSEDEAYAVEDLEDANLFGGTVMIADAYDADEEVLPALAGSDLDLEDADVAVFGAAGLDDIEANDVVYVFEDTNNVDYVLVVGSLVNGTLDEGSDNTITVEDNDYNFDSEDFASEYSTEGIDGSYDTLDDISDLDDVFDTDVMLALYANPYEVAYLVSDVEASSATVYGIVTDLTISGLFDKVTDVTILNQDGEEVTYDVDDVFTYGAGVSTDVELGAYVEVELDADGVIDTLNDMVYADAAADDTACSVSSSKIKIDGTWYKITDDTLIFETVVVDGGTYADSADFDEANLIDVDELMSADELTADAIIIVSNDGGTLERLFVVDSSLNAGNEGYSFVERQYTNSSGDFVEMMDGTIAERDGSYLSDIFYSYVIKGGELEVTALVSDKLNVASATTDGDPVEDGLWVMADGTLASADNSYVLGSLDVNVDAVDGDTLTLAGDYYTLTSDTVIYTVSASGVVDSGDEDDIDDGAKVLAISDEDANLMYVFVLSGSLADPS